MGISSSLEAGMELSPLRRKSGNSLISSNILAGLHYGFRSFTKPHLGYRLGLLWMVLDPLLKAGVYMFLMIVIKGRTSPESLVIGVFTLSTLNGPFSSSMNINLSNEPFPLNHTPTLPLIIAKITEKILSAIFVSLTAATLLIYALGTPSTILLVLPVACSLLTLIGTGTGLLLSPFVMVFKDLSKFVSYFLLLSFFIQCVLFPYSMTSGYHRMALYWLPHTIAVEWCRTVAYGSNYPFTLEHSIAVFLIWAVPMIYGFVRFDRYRWRATTW